MRARRDHADRLELLGQFFRRPWIAIRHREVRRLERQQWREHAAHRATGAEDQYALAFDGVTESRQIARQTFAVGVVAVPAGLGALEGIDRAGKQRSDEHTSEPQSLQRISY